MPYYPKLTGEKCYLSPIQLEDAENWAVWLNDLSITVPLGDEAYLPYSIGRLQEEIAEAVRRQDHIFSIVDKGTDRSIGRCMLFSFDLVNRTAMLGLFIGEKDMWDQGYGSEAVRLLLDYAFNLLNLHAVMLGTYSFNLRAQHAYEKLGFKVIGRRRENRWIGGKAYDSILMDMLEDEFRARYPSVIHT